MHILFISKLAIIQNILEKLFVYMELMGVSKEFTWTIDSFYRSKMM